MTIRNIVAVSMIASASLVSQGTLADTGFAPWNTPRTVSTPDVVQNNVQIRQFGVDVSPIQSGSASTIVIDRRQAEIDLKPWYLKGAI